MNNYRSNYFEQSSPMLRWVSEAQIEELHFATLEVLERTGIKVQHQGALKLLKDAGCKVQGERVWIPNWLVEECIKLAPRKITLGNRNGKRVMSLEKNSTYFGPGSDLPFTIDHETGLRRKSSKRDVELASTLVDNLHNIDFMMSYAIASDCTEKVSDLHQFEAMVRNTVKPIVFTAHNAENTKAIIEMAAIAVGGYENLSKNPLITLYSEPISPLVHTVDGVGKMFACFDHDIPVIYTPGVLAGATTPVTKAGCIVLMNAEALAGVVMAQLYKKGAPVIIGGGATPIDMKSTATLYGSPDAHMNYALMTLLSQYYQIPNFTEAGCVDAPVPDAQAGMEAGISLLLAQLSGANLVHDVGYLEGGLTGHLPFLAMCNDFIDAGRYMGRGTKIDRETMAVDVIDEVGPGGNYVTHEHTFKHFKTEVWQPTMFNRLFWQQWEEKGKKTINDYALERVKQILASEQQNQLVGEKVAEINRVIADIANAGKK
ncbi:MAG: trimethylamine methyltransferase family protein [Bacillota bacterium]|nr:trimethylamine methyltransferase family protein [Bacillota bacterium]